MERRQKNGRRGKKPVGFMPLFRSFPSSDVGAQEENKDLGQLAVPFPSSEKVANMMIFVPKFLLNLVNIA